MELGRCAPPNNVIEQLLSQDMKFYSTAHIYSTTVPLKSQSLAGTKIVCRDVIGNIVHCGFIKVDMGVNQHLLTEFDKN